MITLGIEFWATTFDFVGKILIAIMALLVHARIRKEHKIDDFVLKEMHLEEFLGVLGILLIILGYVLKLWII